MVFVAASVTAPKAKAQDYDWYAEQEAAYQEAIYYAQVAYAVSYDFFIDFWSFFLFE